MNRFMSKKITAAMHILLDLLSALYIVAASATYCD